MPLGQGDFQFELVDGWPNLPEGWIMAEASDAAIDSRGRIYVFTRGKHPIMVFDKEGNFVTSWGYGEFGLTPHLVSQSHGIFISPDDEVYLTDSLQHIVQRYSRLGDLEHQWGTVGVCKPTYNKDQFNMPTGVAMAPDGTIYVSDGYGNRCVHKFTGSGEHLKTWGEAGSAPGQFAVVHNLGVDSTGRVLVCDRENDRIQIFDPDGQFMEEWTGMSMPGDVWITADDTVYVAEQGESGHLSVWTAEGERISRFSGTEGGVLTSPHGLCVDDEGSVYVAEIGNGKRVQKFAQA